MKGISALGTILIASGTLLAACGVQQPRQAVPLAPGFTYVWQCQMAANPRGSRVFEPAVTIRNPGSQAIHVNDISVAIFSPDGRQVASADVGQAGWETAYIAPGSSLTFTDDHGVAYPSQDTCKVESLA